MSLNAEIRKQLRMCLAKRVFLSDIGAQIAASSGMRRKPGLKLRAYQCPNCAFWHLTSKPLKGASRPKRRPVMTRKS